MKKLIFTITILFCVSLVTAQVKVQNFEKQEKIFQFNRLRIFDEDDNKVKDERVNAIIALKDNGFIMKINGRNSEYDFYPYSERVVLDGINFLKRELITKKFEKGVFYLSDSNELLTIYLDGILIILRNE